MRIMQPRRRADDNRSAVADPAEWIPPQLAWRMVLIRVLYGRRMVGDDGYPGLRFAYPGLNASTCVSASHASHVLTTLSGVCDTPRKVVRIGREPGGRMPTGFSRG